jgi:phospho-N-acetylmuramoyl-pentapeptide-transferase
MISVLVARFQNEISCLNFLNYVSVRGMAAFLTVLLVAIVGGDYCIAWAQRCFRSRMREYTPERHREKVGTPTMGGIFFIAAMCVTMVLWCNMADPHVWVMMLCLVLFSCIGLWDDWSKLVKQRGISERYKLCAQIAAATVVVSMWYITCHPDPVIVMPIFKGVVIPCGLLVAGVWWIFVIVAMSNAVNLTDGLDGLAIGSLIPNFATFSLIAYAAGHAGFAKYLHIPFAGTAEVAIIGAIFVGASLGFLWFNMYPAQIIMGDVGALPLGAALALMAIMSRQEVLMCISGIVFVAETCSVIMQVISYRHFGRRIFRMAPLHHHFELLGWPEAKITVRFGIITIITCLVTLMLIKIR